jgi:hypothetical protein
MASFGICHLIAFVVLVLLAWAFVAVFGRIVNRAVIPAGGC